MLPLQRIKPIDIPTMHEELQDRLKEYILANKLQAGDPLPTEAQLADQLGVSRAAVREGLRSLESLGLIYSRRGEGRYVRGFNLDPILENLHYSLLFDTEDVREMIDIRERLEMGFIGDAIAAMDPVTLGGTPCSGDRDATKGAVRRVLPGQGSRVPCHDLSPGQQPCVVKAAGRLSCNLSKSAGSLAARHAQPGHRGKLPRGDLERDRSSQP